MMEKSCLVQWGRGERAESEEFVFLNNTPRWDWVCVPSTFPMLNQKLGPEQESMRSYRPQTLSPGCCYP